MILLLLYGPYLLLSVVTLFCGKLFERAGLPAIDAYKPLINIIYWFKITRLRPVLALLFFVPYLNLLFVLFFVIAIHNSYNWGNDVQYKKGNAAATTDWSFLWIDIIVFMLLKRAILNAFIFSVFSIPTSSMEKTYLTGNMVIAEKISYGPRLPVTPLSIPFMRSWLPHSYQHFYSTLLQLPYFRFPATTTVQRNDVMVFNYPMQDELPVDKREYYMKRCVALPGDTLQMKDAVLYVNGEKAWQPPLSQKMYLVRTDGVEIDFRTFEAMGVTDGGKYTAHPGLYMVGLTAQLRDQLKAMPHIKSVEPWVKPAQVLDMQNMYFPPDTAQYLWNSDQYGPLWIPKKGMTVPLNKTTLPLYQRIIAVYEHNKLDTNGTTILINGTPADHYTFRMNYYFMMGDNRDNSEDSRYWGFVPEDHIDSKVWRPIKLPKWLVRK